MVFGGSCSSEATDEAIGIHSGHVRLIRFIGGQLASQFGDQLHRNSCANPL